MGKTYEALERAEKEFKDVLGSPVPGTEKSMIPERPSRLPVNTAMEKYQQVKVKLINRFPDAPVKTILVTSTAHGGGSTTTAVGFATALARDCKLRVLLIDVNLRSPSLHQIFDIDHDQGLFNLLTRQDKDKPAVFKKTDHGDLYVIPSGGTHSGPLTLFESIRFDNFLKGVREKFSYVILDAPPVNGCSESRILGPKVDGVILVVESGKTRRQVAVRAKQELEDAGANVLGVVLNNRKHYIPEWIYKRL